MPYILLTLIAVVLDQGVKAYVQHQMTPFQSIPVIPGVFSLTYTSNYGAAFGILWSQRVILIAITLAVFGMVWLKRKQITEYPRLFQQGLGLALGGALGNFVDRVRTGYVFDFIDVHVWPVFNIADMAIVIGVGLIILGAMQRKPDEFARRTEGAAISGPSGDRAPLPVKEDE